MSTSTEILELLRERLHNCNLENEAHAAFVDIIDSLLPYNKSVGAITLLRLFLDMKTRRITISYDDWRCQSLKDLDVILHVQHALDDDTAGTVDGF